MSRDYLCIRCHASRVFGRFGSQHKRGNGTRCCSDIRTLLKYGQEVNFVAISDSNPTHRPFKAVSVIPLQERKVSRRHVQSKPNEILPFFVSNLAMTISFHTLRRNRRAPGQPAVPPMPVPSNGKKRCLTDVASGGWA